MIEVSKEEISFSITDPEKRPWGRPRDVLTRKLHSAHVCPWCGVLAQAIYYTDKRVEDVAQEFFGLHSSATLAKFADSTARHNCQPRYSSFLISAGGQTAEIIRESSHFSIDDTRHQGCCKVSRAVHFPGPFNLVKYLLPTIKYVTSGKPWREALSGAGIKGIWESLAGPDLDRVRTNAEHLFSAFRSRIQIAEDVTGNGSPLWLLARDDWSYNSVGDAARGLIEAPEVVDASYEEVEESEGEEE